MFGLEVVRQFMKKPKPIPPQQSLKPAKPEIYFNLCFHLYGIRSVQG